MANKHTKKSNAEVPLVSVIILNMNGEKLVKHLVSSIRKSSYKNIEIILADNGSTDGSKELDKEMGITVSYLKENKGTGAYNYAYKKAKGNFIVIMGNDMEVHKDSIKNLYDFMIKNPQCGLAVPKFYNFTHRKVIDCAGNWLSRSFYSGLHKTGFLGKNPKKIPYGIGMLRREAIEQFGYIMDPEYFLYAEDVDLGARLWISGWEVWYIPNSIMYHMGSMSTKIFPSPKLAYLSERNMIMAFLTTLSIWNIILLSPYAAIMRLMAIFKDIISLRFKVAVSRINGLLWCLFHPNIIVNKRAIVQKNRKNEDHALLSLCIERFLFT